MHMADALVSPAVGGAMWAATCGVAAVCVRKVNAATNEGLVPLMGVLGAFVFTAQMINFAIPGTGSSGHLGGGLLLAVLLGPYAAFLVIASVLTVQALFFADGGLLALGCNVFNLGFYPAFVAYPFLYRPLADGRPSPTRTLAAAVVAAVVGLQLGAFSVVLETQASGLTDVPFGTFLLLMQPIHLAIGVAEGLATAAVVACVARVRPDVLSGSGTAAPARGPRRRLLLGLLAAAVAVGGALSWFASTRPDGLEWSVARATGRAEPVELASAFSQRVARWQAATAVFPDYGFRASAAAPAAKASETWPAVKAETSVSGLVGGGLTLGLVVLAGWALKALRTRRENV